MAESRPTQRVLPFLLAIALLLTVGACGVSATGTPVDEGDAIAGGSSTTDVEKKEPPSPDDTNSADVFVRNFLKAAAGGLSAANDRVKRYLTGSAREKWINPPNPDSPPLTIVRISRGPTTGTSVGGRTPVTVDFQVVGTMNDQGRVEELVELAPGQMTFWVVPDEGRRSNVRIDEIVGAPAGLLLSDEALADFYRLQPIYLWDSGYTTLVPDLRYVPLTITPDQRALSLLRWLAAGPSPWLSGVQRLPPGTDVDLRSDGDRLQVRLSAQAGNGGPEALRRLMFQIQWTLSINSSVPLVDLFVDDKAVSVGVAADEFLQYNNSFAYRGQPTRYNVNADRKVVMASPGTLPTVLSGPENATVSSAAVGQGGSVAALVRTDSADRRYLQTVRDGVAGHVDAAVPRGTQFGRPSFVPGLPDVVLLPTGGPDGRLLAVSTVDGSYTNITRNVSGVSTATVAPDGRRVAFVAAGQVYVASLIVSNGTVSVGSVPRPILAGQLSATSVTWASESLLFVAGVAGGASALWRVTADGVVAQNLSDAARDLFVTDMVAFPQWSARGGVEVLAVTQNGVYAFRSLFTQDATLRAPFFGT